MPQLDFFVYFSTELTIVFFISVFLFSFFSLFILNFFSSHYLLNKFSFSSGGAFASAVKSSKFFFLLDNLFFLTSFGYTFQTPGNVDMIAIISTHNDICYFLQIILILVFWLLSYSVYTGYRFIYPYHSHLINSPMFKSYLIAESFDSCTLLEIIWTVLPSVILVFIGYPSISLLYSLDEHMDAEFFVKIIGHQWYWTYEYPLFKDSKGMPLSYDSNMLENTDIRIQFQNMNELPKSWLKDFKDFKEEMSMNSRAVDYPLMVPAHYRMQAIMTSSDVLHSWAMPALGIKMDACPGRLNKMSFQVDIDSRVYNAQLGSNMMKKLSHTSNPYWLGYWGQCSELCGVGHGFMPIVMHAMAENDFLIFFDSMIFGKPWKERVMNKPSKSSLSISEAYVKAMISTYPYIWEVMCREDWPVSGAPLKYKFFMLIEACRTNKALTNAKKLYYKDHSN